MTTPFADLANAELIFQVPAGAGAIDELGNPVAETVDLVVVAMLREDTKIRENEQEAGSEDSVLYVKGRCIEPTELPRSLLPGAKATAVVNGLVGEFFLKGAIASPFGVDEVLGGQIKGRFVTRVAWGDAL